MYAASEVTSTAGTTIQEGEAVVNTLLWSNSYSSVQPEEKYLVPL